MSYIRKTWVNGEVITADGLNNIEEGIAEAKKDAEGVVVAVGNAQTTADDAKAAAGAAAEAAAAAANAAQKNIDAHNTNAEAHPDIRLELMTLANRIAAVLDSDDITLDELSEIVAYIKSNKELIDAITTSKVSVADIVDNLYTKASDKPLSAAQGYNLAQQTSSLRSQVNSKASSNHGHTLTSLSGTLSVAKGGTGATTAAAALKNLGLTATADELNHMDGVNRNVQEQFNDKLDRGATAAAATKLATARNITANLGADTSDPFNGAGDAKIGVEGILPVFKGGTGAATAASALKNLGLTATAAELNYMDGVNSNVQEQLDGKAPSSHRHELTSLSGTLPVSKGGTGAVTAAAALKNLGIVYSETEPEYVEGMIWLKPV